MHEEKLKVIEEELGGHLVIVGVDDYNVRWVEKDGKRVELNENDDIKEKVKELK